MGAGGTGGRATGLAGAITVCLLAVSAPAVDPAGPDSELPAVAAYSSAEEFHAANGDASVSLDRSGDVKRIFGRRLSEGTTPSHSADAFIDAAAAPIFHVKPDELIAEDVQGRASNTLGVSYDRATGQYRFTAVAYIQQRAGLKVFETRLVVLVRNVPGHPVVLANSQLRDLGDFQPERDAVDAPLSAAAQHAALARARALTELGQGAARTHESRKVIFAGVDDVRMAPVLADEVIVEHGPEKWRIVVDAATGTVLHEQALICRADLSVLAVAKATEGIAADFCEDEIIFTLPYLKVDINGQTHYLDETGTLLLTDVDVQPYTVTADLSGRWFSVQDMSGPNEVIIRTATPPMPIILTFNFGNFVEQIRAQANAYVFANNVRDFVLDYNPGYPTLNATGFPVFVNRDDSFCPGNAWYDLLDASLHFCEAGVSDTGQHYPNTAWSSVVYHEFGHHLVEVSGSGQGQYGEGIGDSISTIMLDTSLMALGFFNNCVDPLRTAEAGVQVPCNGPIHFCGQALSGCIWDTRNELIATNPDDYRDILADLTINSILVHTGSMIDPDLVIDFLTLDDDNGNIFDGTPHFDAIATGFAAHGMIIPELDPIGIDFPTGRPKWSAPDGSTTLEIAIRPISGAHQPGQAWATFIIDGQQSVVPLQPTGRSDLYEVQIPSSTCGSRILYSISAEATDGTLITSPFDAPNNLHESFSAFGNTTVHRDDFESDGGWFTETLDATDGWWQRGVPVGDFNWSYAPSADSDGSGQCWLTGNAPGNSDVDGGSVRLTSPALPFLVDRVMIEYDYFLRLTNENGNDRMAVEVTDGNGLWVEVVRHDEDAGFDWQTHSITPGEMLAAGLQPTGTVQIRFTVSDLTPQSIVEAALDNVRVRELDCDPDAVPGDVTGDGLVDVFDLIQLLTDWGACAQPCPPSCPADFTDDCQVDVFDLIIVLNSWSG